MQRIFPEDLADRWKDPKGLIQVFLGPRQVGKTTAASTLAERDSTVFFSADAPSPPSARVIEEQWEKAREVSAFERTLVLDEVQKIPGWSEVVKRLWDEDRRNSFPLRVALLGSSALLIERGLSESLTGRFEMNFFPHWSFAEVRQLAPSISLETYALLGGYPKVYDFLDDLPRARAYIENSIIEPTLGRDILALHAVDKPALLRQLFWYVSRLPSQIVSYEKILGHLQDRGNSATLVHYAELLRLAFIVVPIFKYSLAPHRRKRSLPKWIFPNPALVDPSAASAGCSGFVFENLVGAHLLNITYGRPRFELSYLRDGDFEVDFILTESGDPLLAVEVKSGRSKRVPSAAALQRRGISCPLTIVDRENVEEFLGEWKIEGLLSKAGGDGR